MTSTLVSQRNGANIQGSPQPELDADRYIQQTMEPSSEAVDTLTAHPQSPLQESDYDKLLVSSTKETLSQNVLQRNLEKTCLF